MTITPFRWPGAKNKLLSTLMPYLDDILKGQYSFSDAFVGGGSVLLAVATKYPTIQLFANDLDYGVYCFWYIIANKDRTQLDALLGMMETKPTIELFNYLRKEVPLTDVDCAYHCIFFNRCCFSGIARSGPIGGQNQSKWTVDCRYNFSKLKSKIEKCHQLLKGRTIVEPQNILEYQYLLDTNDPVYLDPPYFHKGDMLYTEKMNNFDHNKMADILNKRTHWVLSYDDCPEIKQLYKNNRIIDVSARYCIDGKKTDWKGKNELIILP